MYRDIILVNHRFGIEVVLCSNAETICDGYEIPDHEHDEVTSEVVKAMRDKLLDEYGEVVDDSRTFSDWHGKHWDRKIGRVACRTVTRDAETDEDGDTEMTDWRWVKFDKMPKIVQEKIDAILNMADDAGIAAISEAEEAAKSDEAE